MLLFVFPRFFEIVFGGVSCGMLVAPFFICVRSIWRCAVTEKDNHVMKLGKLISPLIEKMGFVLVRVEVFGDKDQTLQIMADRADGSGITIEDCSSISREVSSLLNFEEKLSQEYNLEVSSPGIDRPLMGASDYQKFMGFEIGLETKHVRGGRKKFKGIIVSLDKDIVKIDSKGEMLEFPIECIEKAKLLLREEALSSALRAAEG